MKKGSKQTEESKAKMSEAKKGKPSWIKGKHHSEETRQKIRDYNLKNNIRPPTREGTITSEETRKKMSESHEGQKTWNKGKKGYTNAGSFKKGQTPWIKGKKMPKEAVEKQRISLIKTLSNPELRKKLSDATKRAMSNSELIKKLSEIRKKGIASGKIKTWNKGKRPSEETIKKQRATLIKILSNPQVREMSSERSRKTILRMYESGAFPRQENTKPERQIKEELFKRGYKEGIDFIHQYKFMNKFMCDFCFPQKKVIVEVYGDFWHANPKKYPAGTILHKHQLKDMGRDKSKEAYIKTADNHTWTYLVIWESDIKRDVATCVDKIEEVLQKRFK